MSTHFNQDIENVPNCGGGGEHNYCARKDIVNLANTSLTASANATNSLLVMNSTSLHSIVERYEHHILTYKNQTDAQFRDITNQIAELNNRNEQTINAVREDARNTEAILTTRIDELSANNSVLTARIGELTNDNVVLKQQLSEHANRIEHLEQEVNELKLDNKLIHDYGRKQQDRIEHLEQSVIERR